MKSLILYCSIIFSLFTSTSILAQITFDPNAGSTGNPGGNRATIFINGNMTGDDLRNFIVANPAAGSINNRDITFSSELKIQGTLTDENSVYHFPDIYRYAPQNGAIVNFTDITIHYTGVAKGHSYNAAYTANFDRVFYLQGVTAGRSDFFNNGNYTFNMNDVTLVSYGVSDFLHFQTTQTLNNITIVNAQGGLNFEPGARNAGDIEVINNLKLKNVTRIVGGSGSNGDFKTYDMNWDATNWNFSQRNVDFFFVNPIKPTGWTGYSGSASQVKEYYTHDVIVTDNAKNPLSNLTITLYNNSDTSFDYTILTDAQGVITTQEVLKIDNSRGLNFDRGASTLVIPEYSKEYYAVDRDFNSAIKDNVVIVDDKNVTETNQTIVTAYTGIAINHTGKTVTISSNHSLCEVYDFIKLNKMTNLTQPSISNLLVDVQGETLNINDYQFILTGAAIITPCEKFAKIKSDQPSVLSDVNNLKTGLEDANGLFKLISLTNINQADVIITDENTGSIITSETNFTGESNTVTQINSTQIRILVTRDGYTTWATTLDLFGITDTFRFEVFQATSTNPATVSNQETILYLTKKILQKSEGILVELNGTTPNVIINNNTQPATINATEERQEQMISLLKRILSKTTAIKKSK